jgi:hypothetical protein
MALSSDEIKNVVLKAPRSDGMRVYLNLAGVSTFFAVFVRLSAMAPLTISV